MDMFASTFGGRRHFLRCKAPHEHIPWVAYSIQRTGRVAERCGAMSEGSSRSRAHNIGCKIVSTFYRSACYSFSNTHSLAFTGIAFPNWLEQRVLSRKCPGRHAKFTDFITFRIISTVFRSWRHKRNWKFGFEQVASRRCTVTLGFGASSEPMEGWWSCQKRLFDLWDLRNVSIKRDRFGSGSAEGWELLKTFLRNLLTTWLLVAFFHKKEVKKAS